jgi:hypothetical protein
LQVRPEHTLVGRPNVTPFEMKSHVLTHTLVKKMQSQTF